MKPADTIKNLFENSKISVGPEVDRKILNKATNALLHEAAQPDTTIWSLIMHTKRIQFLAAAAVVLIAVGLSLVYWQSNKEIQIPPELAAMSVDELIKLHYEQNDTAFSPDIIKTALQRALKKTNPEQVIQIAKALVPKKGRERSYDIMAPPPHPIPHAGYTGTTFHDVMEKSDFFVHAYLDEIEINVDDLINALIAKEPFQKMEDAEFFSRYRVTIPLEIIETQPEGMLQSGDIIALNAVISEDKLKALRNHSEYYCGLTLNKNDEINFLDYVSGVYAVDNDNPVYIDFWQFLADAQDVLQYGKTPEQITIDYWVSKLTGETSALALEYMDTLPDELIPASGLMDFVENQYDNLIQRVQQGYNELEENGQINLPAVVDSKIRDISSSSMDLFNRIIELLLRAGDKESIDRMLLLFDSDMDYGDRSVFLWRFNYPYDTRMKFLIVRLIEAADEDALSNRLMELYTANKDVTWRDMYVARVYAYNTKSDYIDYTRIQALSQCGTREEAILQALKILAVPPKDESINDLMNDMFRNGDLLLFLGTAEGDDILEVINEFTQQDYINHYVKVYEELGQSQAGYWWMSGFQQNAVMALARIGGQSVIPRLRKIYNTSDIRIKIVASLALYYNGDMTGEELVRKFVEGTHRQDPEINNRWGQDITDGNVFQDIISSYLRNDLTDALLLEKLTHYLDRADTDVNSGFFKDYKSEIFHTIVEQLNNKDRTIRGYAIFILRNATSQNFGFDPDIYHGRQDDIIQQWRDYLDQEYPASEVYF